MNLQQQSNDTLNNLRKQTSKHIARLCDLRRQIVLEQQKRKNNELQNTKN